MSNTETPLDPPSERILQAIHHLEHLVPGQAVITDFVHHNTLHGFQKFPFPQALAEARKITGIYGYLSLTRFRLLLKQGRITHDDLDAVIADDPELAATERVGPTSRGQIVRLVLEHDLHPLSSTQLTWEINERKALTRAHPDINETSRQRYVTMGESQAISDLWHACLELFELQHSEWYREHQLDLSAEEQLQFPSEAGSDQDHARQQTIIQQIRKEADQHWEDLTSQVGVTMTLRGLLLALTGEDILEEQRAYLLRGLAAFLDLGVANWSLPDRKQGFYSAWKQMALAEHAFVLEEMPHWHNDIADLPPTAMEAIQACLNKMGLPEERWGGYLERLALELPGWSGMMMWRALRPNYQGMAVQVEMLDYLAVRLVLERLFAIRLCRIHWLLEPSLDTLGWYFRHQRGELYVRWSLFHKELPEFLATRASRLLHRPHDETSLILEWQKLAFAIWTGQQHTGILSGHAHGARDQAWPLFLLAQHLGMSGAELRQGGRIQAEQMRACLASIHDEKAGYLWLQAYERHYRNQIFAALRANQGRGRWPRRDVAPTAQVIFCMDDREEGIRRHLEERVPTIETLGAAGFFGVPIHWRGLDDTVSSALCPVVVTPSHEIHEYPTPGSEGLYQRHRQRRRWRLWCKTKLFRDSHRAWLAPVVLPLLVGPLALVTLAGKLLTPWLWGRLSLTVREWFERSPPTTVTLTALDDGSLASPKQPRRGFTDEEQVGRVVGFLRTIGLTYGFAPLVAILGHGSSSQNNPHLAAYDCGACSGRHGGPNARLFAAMANRPDVRERLLDHGIHIPAETWFIGGEHDTGNETIQWFDEELTPVASRSALIRLTEDLNSARAGSAHERARRLASAPRDPSLQRALMHMQGRGMDCSQARPELGHATNAVALIGRRSVTQGVFFDRRMFLISYDPTQDQEGTIVEAILLAAGPVGAGISLEYYFSTVDNENFGCGTKIVHNITGLFGVMEGTSSDLRTGLPQQMIEIHEAMRLLVVVEQRPEILTRIYHRQPEIQELVGNAWIVLACMDPETGTIQQFHPDRGWEVWNVPVEPLPVVPNSVAWYAGHVGPLAPALIVQ
ncbi:MAG: DUF2309 domain-containing protein [Magnetococcus sp. YQC-5]